MVSYARINIHQRERDCQEKNAMISGIFHIAPPVVLYYVDTVVLPGPVGKGKSMKIGKKELENMRDELDRLLSFIRSMECGELPYFYRYFNTMKLNIDMFFCIGGDDIADFFPVLERDWKASHMMFIGVQDYDPREGHPEMDPMVCLYFARLVAEVGKYFERGRVEFVPEDACLG